MDSWQVLITRTHTHKTVTQQREREGPTETALPGRFDKLSIRFRGVLRPGGPASGPAGTMTCSWTFGPSLPVRPARLSSAHALHPPDPGPCAGIGEDQRKTSLPGPRACHAEGKTPRASAGPGHGPQERRLSTARASEHPAGLPLSGRLEKPELLGAHQTRTPRGSAAARRPGENARGLWLSPLLSLRPPSKLTLCTKVTGGRKLLA